KSDRKKLEDGFLQRRSKLQNAAPAHIVSECKDQTGRPKAQPVISANGSYEHEGDPKPENETARRLSPAAGCGPLDESGRRKNAEERTHRRANHLRLAASRRRPESGRCLPGDGDIAAGVLQLEETLRGI